jgi:transcriptional regulator with XRE-family HTH domain
MRYMSDSSRRLDRILGGVSVLGQAVRQARHTGEMSQAQLAKLAGVSRRHIAAIERGANPSAAVLFAIIAALPSVTYHLGDFLLVHLTDHPARRNGDDTP